MHLYPICLTAFWIVALQVDLAFTFAIGKPGRPRSTTLSAWTSGIDYFWPLVGLNLNASVPWGLNVSITADGVSFSSVYEISFEESLLGSSAEDKRSSSSTTNKPQTTAVSTVLQQNNGEINAINIVNDGTPRIVVGPNANYTDANTSASVPTIPFGINLGQNGVWNGSLTLSGTFDVNRIASTRWMQLRSSSSEGYLSGNGQNGSGTIQGINSPIHTDFELDFNSEAIILPNPESIGGGSDLACGNDLTFIMNGGEVSIRIPGNITNAADRCYIRNTSDQQSQVTVLGRPFLQAAYAYFDDNGSIWVTQANQYDLPVNPQPFDSVAALVPPSPPTTWQLAHPNWYNYLETPSGITQYVACLAGFGLLMFIFVILCNDVLL